MEGKAKNGFYNISKGRRGSFAVVVLFTLIYRMKNKLKNKA